MKICLKTNSYCSTAVRNSFNCHEYFMVSCKLSVQILKFFPIFWNIQRPKLVHKREYKKVFEFVRINKYSVSVQPSSKQLYNYLRKRNLWTSDKSVSARLTQRNVTNE